MSWSFWNHSIKKKIVSLSYSKEPKSFKIAQDVNLKPQKYSELSYGHKSQLENKSSSEQNYNTEERMAPVLLSNLSVHFYFCFLVTA